MGWTWNRYIIDYLKKYFIYLFFCNIVFNQSYINPNTYGNELLSYLENNYKTSSTLGYNNARDIMYSEIDIKLGNQLTGVYCGYTITLDISQDPSTNAYEQGINCEHTWPQSLGSGSEPMKSDMHHLFPTKSNVNSSRGNDPFDESNDQLTDNWYRNASSQNSIPQQYINEYAEKYNPSNQNDERFEPREEQKGNTSRAMAYFYTMYLNVSDDQFWDIQKDVLFDWHYYDQVDETELNRTWSIALYQSNIPNPFIIDPTVFWRSYFIDEYPLGDVNHDLDINILDIVMVVEYVLNNNNFSQLQVHQSDFSNDFSIDVIDIILFIEYLL